MSHPEKSRIEIEQELRQMSDEWVKALVRGDGDILDRIMSDDFYFAYPMEGNDKAEFISDVTSGQVRVEYLNRENITVRIFGEAAVLMALDRAKWFYQGRDFGGNYKILHVYARREGKWQLVCVQAVPI